MGSESSGDELPLINMNYCSSSNVSSGASSAVEITQVSHTYASVACVYCYYIIIDEFIQDGICIILM